MNWPLSQDMTVLLGTIGIILGVVALIALALALWVIIWIKRIDLPAHADFVTTLRATPLIVVIILDLLDFSLDIFSAPITWFLLGRLGLRPLRAVAVIEDLIPMTNVIPTMTMAWVYANFVAQGARRQPILLLPRRSRTG